MGYETCGGESQSPVDLSDAVEDEFGCALDFQGYEVPVWGMWQNNGHSIQFTLDGDSLDLPSVTTCDDVFELLQVHFHWGSKGSVGSEHTINGTQHSLEMHMVHKNIKDDNLLVVGLLFDQSRKAKPFGLNFEFEDYLMQFQIDEDRSSDNPEMPGSMIFDKYLDMGGFKHSHYVYSGSLTTPPCSEIVTWIVGTKVPKIPRRTLDVLRQMKDSHGEPLVDNFRPVQKLNGRTIRLVRSA